MKLMIKFFITWFLLVMIASCGVENQQGEETNRKKDEQPITVFTTIFPLQDFTKKIGGDHVDVKSIIPIGADAHTFEPTAKVMIDLANADLYIYNGAGIEGFADATAEVLKTSDVKTLIASKGINLIDFNSHFHHDETDEHHSDKDPHIWLDPIRSIKVAENIKTNLIELKPEAKDEFEANFQFLKSQLEALDQSFMEMVNGAAKNTIIVSHAGYGYWSERYGINQISISGLSPSNEPSFRQLQNVMTFAKENGISYVLFERNIPTTMADTVISQIGAKGLWLHNLEALTTEDVEKNEDYFSLMEKNMETLRTALQ